MLERMADAAGYGVAHVDVRHAGTGSSSLDAAVGDLFGGDRYVGAFAGGIAGASDGAGQNDITVHGISL